MVLFLQNAEKAADDCKTKRTECGNGAFKTEQIYVPVMYSVYAVFTNSPVQKS